jgi:signal transduction histidine kinase/ligand-binding sensor domain-containing protein
MGIIGPKVIAIGKSRAVVVVSLLAVLCSRAFALDPRLSISQYAHTAWTFRDGFSTGNIFSMAQTPDGYFWLGGEFGIFRFDGVRAVPWQPPAGQELPEKFAFQLVSAHDGTLWIGTFSGLASWDGVKLTRHPEFAGRFVQSLFADHEGTVWVGTRGGVGSYARLCAMRRGSSQCFGDDGALGKTIWTISEDRSGVLRIGSDSGIWRWKPGPPRRETTELRDVSGLVETEDGHILASTFGGGLMQLEGRLGAHPVPYPMRLPIGWTRPLSDREFSASTPLRDRNGGLWIGTSEHGLVHLYNGRTDVFTKADGLSGDIVNCLFEDREGNVWVCTTGGIDRFREFAVTTISSKEGLASAAVVSVLGDKVGSVWIGTRDGLTRWRNGQSTIFRKANGLPGNAVESLFQDDAGRLWLYAAGELAYFNGNRFIPLPRALPGEQAHSITGDSQGNLWLAGNEGLYRLREGHVVEKLPWPALGAPERAKAIVADRGGVWISFWGTRVVSYFKDGALGALYKTADGLGKGRIADLRLDGDGALWVATEEGGLSRIKDGHVATLTAADGLPCNSILSSIEDNDRSLWLYTGCGLVRIARSELSAWVADPRHRVLTAVLDPADGVRLRALSPSSFSPVAARSLDGKLWFVTGDSVLVVDPRHLPYNDLPPPVHIERIVADGKSYWQGLTSTKGWSVRLPSRIRDLLIDYTAVSLVAPEKVHFRYRLEGQDQDWREVVNDREVQYSNLPPKHYRFLVKACNDSGVWNEEGAALDFVIPPAWYQTNWFRAACVALFLAILWGIYELRVRQLAHQFNMRLEERVAERTRVARDLHDTLLQGFQALLPSLQAGINMLAARPADARKVLEATADHASQAIAEGRDAVQGLRMSTVEKNDLAVAIRTVGEELASAASTQPSPNFNVVVEGASRNLHPILRDEVYRLAVEALRNAFRHAAAQNVEVEIRYDEKYFRLRVRDDGKGIPSDVLSGDGREGHYGLPGMRERAKLVGGKLAIWTELDGGTEIELNIPGARAYVKSTRTFWHFGKRSATDTDEKEPIERE